MSKLGESLQRTGEAISADILPSWTSVIVTLAPIAIRALWQRKLRRDLKNEIKTHLDNYMNEYRSPMKAAQLERKLVRRGKKLDVMKQAQFDALKVVNGKRVCPTGYDYSDIEPGEVPCYFDEDAGSLKKNRSNKIYLGGGRTWPPNSYMGENVVVGSHSTVGENTVLRSSHVLNRVKLKPGCIAKGGVFGHSCEVGDGFIGLGNLTIGDGAKFGRGVDLRVPKGSTVGGYNIGNDVVISANFKMAGTNNVIGHNAQIGSLCHIENADIHRNNLTIRTGGILKGCRLVEGAGDYHAPYKINKCHIEGSNSKPFVTAPNGTFNNCVIEGNVLQATDCVYNKCDMLDVPHISKNCELTDCNVTSQNVCHIGENVIVHGGSLNGCVVEGEPENVNRLIDVHVSNSELSFTHIEDDSMCSSVELGPGCEVRGEVELDRTVALTHDIKFRDYRIEGSFMPTAHNDITVSFYRLNVAGDTLGLHSSKKDAVKYKIFGSDLSHVGSILGNVNHITFGKGVYEGDVISPESDIAHERQAGHSPAMARHKQHVDDRQEQIQNKTENQAPVTSEKPVGDDDEPPIASYDSVSLNSVHEHDDAQMVYGEYTQSMVEQESGSQDIVSKVIKGTDAKHNLQNYDVMSKIEENDRLKAQESGENRQQQSSKFGP